MKKNMNPVALEIKSMILKSGYTQSEIVDMMSADYGWSGSPSNFSRKLNEGTLRYEEAMEAVYAGEKLSDPLHGRQLMFNEVVILEKMGEYAAAYEKAAEYRNAYPEDAAIRTELEFLATRVREDA